MRGTVIKAKYKVGDRVYHTTDNGIKSSTVISIRTFHNPVGDIINYDLASKLSLSEEELYKNSKEAEQAQRDVDSAIAFINHQSNT